MIFEAASVVVAVVIAVAGWLGNRYRKKREMRRDEIDNIEGTVEKNQRRVQTLWTYLFGREDDETDGGLSVEIQDGFDRIEEDIEDVRRRQQTYHEMEMDQMRRLVNALHDEDELDFEREDVFDD